MAVAISAPGNLAKRCRRCLVFETGYSATTATRSMLLSPNPATSKGRVPAVGMKKTECTPAESYCGRMSAMNIRRVVEGDRADWARMRHALWPGSLSDHEIEVRNHFETAAAAPIVFVAEARAGWSASWSWTFASTTRLRLVTGAVHRRLVCRAGNPDAWHRAGTCHCGRGLVARGGLSRDRQRRGHQQRRQPRGPRRARFRGSRARRLLWAGDLAEGTKQLKGRLG